MREYLVKTRRVGDQLMVALPRDLVQAEQLSEGVLVKISVQKAQKQVTRAQQKDDGLGVDDPWRLLE